MSYRLFFMPKYLSYLKRCEKQSVRECHRFVGANYIELFERLKIILI